MDYSKLTDEQLEAISRNDYTKLPDDILKQIVNENQVAPGAPKRSADPPGFNRDAARQAGYSDEEIDGYLRNPQAAEVQAGTVGQEVKGMAQVLAVPAMGALNYALENPLTTAAGAYGIYKGAQLANTARRTLDRVATPPTGGGPVPPAGMPGSPTNPIGGSAPVKVPVTAPTAPVAPSPILDASGRPIQVRPGPVAPQPMPQATAQPDSLTNRVRTAAASKIQNLPGAGMMGSAGRMVGRVLPGAGTVLNAADAYSRAQQGDYLGAGIAGIGAAASPFPILGTAVGMGTGALNAYRDYLKQEEEKKRMQQ